MPADHGSENGGAPGAPRGEHAGGRGRHGDASRNRPAHASAHGAARQRGKAPAARSGDQAVAAAAERAAGTRDANLTSVPPLPIPADTANVRHSPEIDPACLAMLPMVGVWRGTGMFGNNPTDAAPQFGQQISIAHDGRPFLRYESVMWLLSPSGEVDGPGSRELGWLRPQPDGSIEFLVAHAEGRIEVFYGRARSVASWALSTDAVWRTPTGLPVIGATRLYGITAEGQLAYVEERAHEEIDLAPHASAALERIAG